MQSDFSFTRRVLQTSSGSFQIYSLPQLEKEQKLRLSSLPYSIRVLLEMALRKQASGQIAASDVVELATWKPQQAQRQALSYYPGRVLLQDLTGVPLIVDLASMRAAIARQGGDPKRVNPVIPVELVIDHSVHVDAYGSADAFQRNSELEFHRNKERYAFLRWAQQTFQNLKVVPPSTGIVHQVNLELLARVVMQREENGVRVAYPDTVVGTDSHTTMINGLGVLGWGVGGIEAIAAMLDQPVEILIPDVIGFRLNGQLPEGVTPTDLTLTVTQMLRKKGVVDKFVEFFGPGLESLSLADRAMVSNMAPEYGATLSYFPVDAQTLDYLRLSGRPAAQIDLVERYFKEQGMFRTSASPEPVFSDVIELDLSQVEPSLAGPKRPQDRVTLSQVKKSFRQSLTTPKTERGFGLASADLNRSADIQVKAAPTQLKHGSVVIASITSCTNTSNPFVLITAGLLAQKAVKLGLQTQPQVKTSFAPGSRAVTQYLQAAGVLESLETLGFNVIGYGCATCIGNSGPLPEEVARGVKESGIVAATVISGNRNFEGRVHPLAQANYLASPPLVVAYALAGSVDIDLTTEPVGIGKDGKPVFLADLWPSRSEILEVAQRVVQPEVFSQSYANVYAGSPAWNQIESPAAALYPWNPDSTYIQEAPFLQIAQSAAPLHNARCLAVFGDSITTDHISPAGSIPEASPAGRYLIEHGVPVSEFNSYGARRGNDRVMARGTFANIRIKNLMLPGVEGGVALHLPDGQQMTLFAAAEQYRSENVPLIILAGKEYGTGSSRDWAAKGPLLLGVRAVIAESFERIHRSNLVGMGILPLQFMPGENVQSLGLSGREQFSISFPAEGLQPKAVLAVTARDEAGQEKHFNVNARINSAQEIELLQNGGLLPYVLQRL